MRAREGGEAKGWSTPSQSGTASGRRRVLVPGWGMKNHHASAFVFTYFFAHRSREFYILLRPLILLTRAWRLCCGDNF